MEAHDVAFETIKDWAKDQEMPLTEIAIKNLNELILVKPFWKDAITPDGTADKAAPSKSATTSNSQILYDCRTAKYLTMLPRSTHPC